MTAASPLSPRSRRRASFALATPDPGRYLAVEDGAEVVLLALRAGMTRIGRGVSADVRFDDGAVSSRHAMIVVGDDGRAELLDDGSLNGTWVNGTRVRRHVLSEGDVVVVGRQTLRFVEVAGAREGHSTERLVPVDDRTVALAA